jgi:hypothetical protein
MNTRRPAPIGPLALAMRLRDTPSGNARVAAHRRDSGRGRRADRGGPSARLEKPVWLGGSSLAQPGTALDDQCPWSVCS